MRNYLARPVVFRCSELWHDAFSCLSAEPSSD